MGRKEWLGTDLRPGQQAQGEKVIIQTTKNYVSTGNIRAIRDSSATQ